jgi:hypothetical protein
MSLRERARKAGCWLGGHLIDGLADALSESLLRLLVALAAALLSGLLGVGCRHGMATPLRHLLPAAARIGCRPQPARPQLAGRSRTPASNPTSSH